MPEQLNTYEADFYRWTEEMGRRLREHDAAALDWENIAEEIESMGKRDYRALRSRTEVLLTHLLKWRYQPEKRSRSWAGTILTQRSRIQLIVADSPSFEGRIEREMPEVYANAIRKASVETAIPENSFPAECPWTFKAATLECLEL
jgi:hypothetical protein